MLLSFKKFAGLHLDGLPMMYSSFFVSINFDEFKHKVDKLSAFWPTRIWKDFEENVANFLLYKSKGNYFISFCFRAISQHKFAQFRHLPILAMILKWEYDKAIFWLKLRECQLKNQFIHGNIGIIRVFDHNSFSWSVANWRKPKAVFNLRIC